MAANNSWLEEAKAKYYASKNNQTADNVSRAKGQYYLNKYNELGKQISEGVNRLNTTSYVSKQDAIKDQSVLDQLIYDRNKIAKYIINNYSSYGMTDEGLAQFKELHSSNAADQDKVSQFTKQRYEYYSGFESEDDYNTNKRQAGYYDKYKNNTAEELADIITKLPEGSEEYQFAVDYRNSLLYNEYSNYSDEKMAEIEAEYNKYYDPNGRYQMLERKALNPHMSKITDAELRELEGMRARKREFESKYDYKLIEQVRAQDKAQKEYVLPYLEKPDFKENSSAIKVYGDKDFSFDDAVKYVAALPSFAWDTNFTRNIEQATNDEKKVFSYIYNTEGEKAAKEWYENLRPTLSYRASVKTQQEWKDFANENWFNAVLTQIAARGTNIIKGGVAISDIISNIAGVEIDPYDSAHTLVQYAPIVTQEVTKNWGPFGSYAYQLGMGMVDFGAQLLLSKGIGKAAGLSSAATNNIALGIMGTGAAADTITTAKLSGASDAQAIALGTMSGIIEVLCEKASIDTLFGSSKGKLSYFLKNAFTEASEEGISSIANIITDMIVMSDKSEVETLAQKYLEGFTDSKGVYHKANSEAEALAMALTSKAPDVLLDALGGFISGGVLGGISLTSSAISANKAANNIINKNNTQGLIDLGLEMPKDSVAYDTALSLKEQLEVTTADKAKKSVAKLYDSIRQEIGDVVSKYEGNKDAAAYTDYNRALNQYETLNNLVESTDNIVAPNQEATQNIATDTENNAEISTENDLTANVETVAADIKSTIEGKNEGANETVAKPSGEQTGTNGDMGVAQATKKAPKKNANKGIWTEGDMTPKQRDYMDNLVRKMGGVDTSLTEGQNYAKAVGKALGRNVYFKKMIGDGYINKKTGDIYISKNNVNPLNFVLKHELVHFAERNTFKYQEFQDAIIKSEVFDEWLKEKGYDSLEKYEAYIEDLYKKAEEERKKKAPNQEPIVLGKGGATKEIIANFVGERLFTEDGSTLQKLINGLNPSKKQRFVEVIRDFINWLKSKFTKDADKQMQLDIERFENMFNKIYREAHQQFEQENTPTEEANASYSVYETYSGEDLEGTPSRLLPSPSEMPAFVRSFANKTNDLKNGEKRFININTAQYTYFISATGYMKGVIMAKKSGNIFDGIEEIIYEHTNTNGNYSGAESISDTNVRYGLRQRDGSNGLLLSGHAKNDNTVSQMVEESRQDSEPIRNNVRSREDIKRERVEAWKKISENKVKFSIPTTDLDTEYMSAVESGDMETAQRLVDEAAKEAGYDYHLYHGTNADFTKFDLRKHGGKNGKGEGYGIYLAANKEISAPYGKNVIDSYTKFNRLAEGREKTLSYAEVKNLVKKSCELEAKRTVDDGEYDSIAEALKDTWVSNYVYTYDYSSMAQVYADVANILWKENDNDGDIINEIMTSSGAHYDYENALDFYDNVLTPVTNIDGFHYIWGDKNSGGVENDIYLAFKSEQIKSADPVTYDDDGNVIPLSERFNKSEEDIRYSVPDVQDGREAELQKLYRSGDITQEEYELLINKRRGNTTPGEIIKTPKGEADTTPELARRTGRARGDGESKFYDSIQDSNILSDDFKEEAKSNDFIKRYERIANKETMRDAVNALDTGGRKYVNSWFAKKPTQFSAEDVCVGFILLDRYQKVKDYDSASAVAEKLREAGTVSGQTVQAFSILGRFTPEMMIAYAKKDLDTAFKAMIEGKSAEWVKKNKDRFNLTEEEQDFIRRKMVQASELPEGRQKNIRIAEINAMLQNKLPAEKGQAYKALQRISMLLNPKTNVRNIMGNALLVPVHFVDDFISTATDVLISKKTGIRTKSTPANVKELGKAFAKGAYESYDDFRRGINTKDVNMDRFDIGKGKSFNEQHVGKLADARNKLNKALNTLDNLTSFCLEIGDRPFFEMWFINSLNGQMKANKVTEPTAEMIEIATQEALERTWQDNNSFTRSVTGIKNFLNKITGDKFYNTFGYGAGDLFIKFAKTPANLTKAIVEFSPVGLAKALSLDAIHFANDVRKGQATAMNQRNLVEHLSKGISGTLLYVLAYALAAAGILKGSNDEDKDVAAFEKNVLGIQPYSVKIGDKSFSYEWAQPIGAIMAIASDIYEGGEGAKGEKKEWYNNILDALKTGGKVLYNQSFMKGIQNLFAEDDIVTALISGAFDEPAVFIPQMLSQTAGLFDKNTRTSYVYGNEFESAINSVKSKIPGLRNTLSTAVDVFGNEVKNPYNNIWDAYINPANPKSANATPVSEEVYRLLKATGDKSLIPAVSPNYVTINGEKVILSPSEKVEYQKLTGGESAKQIQDLLGEATYKALSDEIKAEVIKDIYEYNVAQAKEEMFGKSLNTTQAKIEKYEEMGLDPEIYLLVKAMQDGNTKASYEDAVNKTKLDGDTKKLLIAINNAEGKKNEDQLISQAFKQYNN